MATRVARRRQHVLFDPEAHRESLLPLLSELVALPPGALRSELDRALRRHPRAGSGFFSRSQLIAGARHFEAPLAAIAGSDHDADAFVRALQMRPVRSQSGVTPITVLTKPFPCPGRCVFCPNDLSMPKSYLADEPGAQRAANHRFDPYLQTWSRLESLRAIGHPTDKVELIVLGGTWSFYPETYQRWFALRCFAAMNDFGGGVDGRADVEVATPDFEALAQAPGERASARGRYNVTVSRVLAEELDGELVARTETASWDALEQAKRDNEDAACRCVGFSVETRPDRVTEDEVVRIRRLGCTKVQLGLQHLDDVILEANRRGHAVADARCAIALLRGAGFKIQAHWMPNLLGSTPEADVADHARLFADPDFRPDELKVYPCSLIESAELMTHFESGAWRPYEEDELALVLSRVLEQTPRYCRITRMIRDISSDDIVTGNKLTNFRQIAEGALAERGGRSEEIRSREIRGSGFDEGALALRSTAYESATGEERFLEFVTEDDRIVGFLRLALPGGASHIAELGESAVIREVHVYGGALEVGGRDAGRAQHRGLGQRLVEAAAEAARDRGFESLAVISAVGTRGYYRRLGFRDGALYQHRALGEAPGIDASSRPSISR